MLTNAIKKCVENISVKKCKKIVLKILYNFMFNYQPKDGDPELRGHLTGSPSRVTPYRKVKLCYLAKNIDKSRLAVNF